MTNDEACFLSILKREQISLLLTFLSINGHFNKIYIKCNKSVLKIIGLVKKFLGFFCKTFMEKSK